MEHLNYFLKEDSIMVQIHKQNSEHVLELVRILHVDRGITINLEINFVGVNYTVLIEDNNINWNEHTEQFRHVGNDNRVPRALNFLTTGIETPIPPELHVALYTFVYDYSAYKETVKPTETWEVIENETTYTD